MSRQGKKSWKEKCRAEHTETQEKSLMTLNRWQEDWFHTLIEYIEIGEKYEI